jgi:hypothetical protein
VPGTRQCPGDFEACNGAIPTITSSSSTTTSASSTTTTTTETAERNGHAENEMRYRYCGVCDVTSTTTSSSTTVTSSSTSTVTSVVKLVSVGPPTSQQQAGNVFINTGGNIAQGTLFRLMPVPGKSLDPYKFAVNPEEAGPDVPKTVGGALEIEVGDFDADGDMDFMYKGVEFKWVRNKNDARDGACNAFDGSQYSGDDSCIPVA